MRSISVHQGISAIRNAISHDKVSILVGAGVSMIAPTSLPSGRGLRDCALGTLFSTPELKIFWNHMKRMKSFQSLIPEVVFQRLYEALRASLWPFFNHLKDAPANHIHRMIAHLAMVHDVPVLTTNFDLLIEQCTNRDCEIVHLHGRIDDPASMTTRINQVGRGLEHGIRSEFRMRTKGRLLCVLGYSGSDKDILNEIMSSGATQVIWLVLDKDDEWTMRNVRMAAQSCDVRVIVADLSVFAAKLHLVLASLEPPLHRGSVRSQLQEWGRTIEMPERFACMYKVLLEVHAYRLATEVAELAPGSRTTIHTKSWFYNEVANSKRESGEFDEGLVFVRKAIESHAKGSSLSTLGAAFNNRGLMLLDKPSPEPHMAIRDFQKAIQTLEHFRSSPEGKKWTNEIDVFIGRCLNNLGLAHVAAGEDEAAEEAYRKALLFKRRAGDLIGLSQTFTNMAIMLYRFRRFAKARYRRLQAASLIRRFHLVNQEAELLKAIGEVACEDGRFKYGVAKLREARRMYSQIQGKEFEVRRISEFLVEFESS